MTGFSEPEAVMAGGDLYLVYLDNMGRLDYIVMYQGGHGSRPGQKIEFDKLCIPARQKIERLLLDHDQKED